MRVSVFGMGYVGSVSAACIARNGHFVVGVDSKQSKVDLINAGMPPVIETGLAELLSDLVQRGRLQATSDATAAVAETALSLICVGTPSRPPDGSLDTQHLARVCEEIGTALSTKDSFHVVVVRSTVTPGTTSELLIPTLENCSGKRAHTDFGFCYNPEFLREGSALYDFDNPAKTVIGASDSRAADVLSLIYEEIDAPLILTQIPVAEMLKYADNCWHGLKVAFANEIGNIAKALGIDSHRVMDIFCQDKKLNLSPAYLKPGQAFGGSCLPKDLRALSYEARTLGLDVPLLSAILPSNRLQMERALRMVLEKPHKQVGVLGFSFKAGTDDLRESPIVEMTERLIEKGFDLRLYDRNVNLARLVGANREFILDRIPHIADLMVDSIDEVLAHGKTIVIGTLDPEFKSVVETLRDDQVIVDLVRIVQGRTSGAGYDGICW